MGLLENVAKEAIKEAAMVTTAVVERSDKVSKVANELSNFAKNGIDGIQDFIDKRDLKARKTIADKLAENKTGVSFLLVQTQVSRLHNADSFSLYNRVLDEMFRIDGSEIKNLFCMRLYDANGTVIGETKEQKPNWSKRLSNSPKTYGVFKNNRAIGIISEGALSGGFMYAANYNGWKVKKDNLNKRILILDSKSSVVATLSGYKHMKYGSYLLEIDKMENIYNTLVLLMVILSNDNRDKLEYDSSKKGVALFR